MPIDYGLDKLSSDELLGTPKAPAAPTVAPAPTSAPVTDYGLGKMSANELLGITPDPAAEAAKSAALFEASFGNPDEEGKKRRLSASIQKATGTYLAPSIMDPKEAERQFRIAEADHATRASPRTSAFLSNAENAKVAIDDAKVLADIEAKANMIWGPLRGGFDEANTQTGLAPARTRIKAIAAAIGGLMQTTDAGSYLFGKMMAPAVAATSEGVAGLVQHLVEPFSGVSPAARDVGVVNPLRSVSDWAARAGADADALHKELLGDQTATGFWERNFLNATQSVMQSAMTMPVGLPLADTLGKVAGSARPALAAFSAALGFALPGGLVQGGQSYSESRREGVSVFASSARGLSDTATETGFEMIPGSTFLKASKGGTRNFALAFLKAQVPEVLTEIPTTLTQNFTKWAVLDRNKGKTWSDFLDEQPAAVLDTAVTTLMAGGGQVALGAIADATNRRQAETSGAALLATMRQAAESLTLRRDPVAFNAFFQEVAGDSTVFVDREQLLQVFAEAKLDINEKLPSAAAQLNQATPEGIEIPIAELVTNLSGSGIEEQLVQHLRMEPNAMTIAEGNTKADEAKAFIEHTVEQIMGAKERSDRIAAELKEIEDAVAADVTGVGRTGKAANQLYGKVIAASYAVMTDYWNKGTEGMEVTPKMVREGWTNAKGVKRPGWKLGILGAPTTNGAATPGAATVLLGVPSTISWKSGKYTFTETRTYEHRADDGRVSRTTVDEDGNTKKEWLIVKKDGAEVWSDGDQLRKDDDYANVTPQRAQEIANEDLPAGATGETTGNGTLTQGFDHGNAMLNVGLDVGATDRAQKIDAAFVEAELNKMGVTVLSGENVDGEYELNGQMVKELTYVPHLSRPLTEAEVNQLAVATGQEAIPQYDNGTGNLWGPNAAAWGDFNPEFFKDQKGTKLSDAQKALKQGAGLKAVDVNSPEFKAWFGDSKVVTEGGKPLRVYHGTNGDFTEFELGHGFAQSDAFFFADPHSRRYVEEYLNVGNGAAQNTRPVYLSLRNPLYASAEEDSDFANPDYENEVIEKAKSAGHDGVVFAYPLQDEKFYAVFSKTQIKSAISNTGAFSNEDPNILAQSQSARRPTAKPTPEDHLGEVPLLVDYTKIEPEKNEQNMALVAKYPGIRFKARTVSKQVEEFIQHVTNNLLWLHDQIPADIRQRSKLWYDGARNIVERWSAKYGHTDAQVSGVLAVFSPQKDWFMNVSLGERTLDIAANQQETPWSEEMAAWFDRKGAEAKKLFDATRVAIEGKALGEIDSKIRRAVWVSAYKAAYGKKAVPTKATKWTPEMSAAMDRKQEVEYRKYADLRKLVEGKKLKEFTTNYEKAVWLRAYDEAHNSKNYRIVTPEGGFGEFDMAAEGTKKARPAKLQWPGYDTIAKALDVLDDGSPASIDRAIGAEHKVRSFYNNIFHPNSNFGFVTIDTHAVAAGLLRPLSGNSVEVTHDFGGAGTATSAATGMSGTYAYYQEAHRRAAQARGLLPREMQSITWEAVRELYTMVFKRDKQKMAEIDRLWTEHEKGKRDAESVRTEILNLAGGVEKPAWVGHDSGIHEGGWASSYTGELLGRGMAGRTGAVAVGAGAGATGGDSVLAQRTAADQRAVGAVSGPVVGIHFSKAERPVLSSSAWGTGMKGAEGDYVRASADKRLRHRIAFYVNTGNGIVPESDVGSHAHLAVLENLYDADADVLKIWRNNPDERVRESAVLDAGFDGYLTRTFGKGGAVVMLGQRNLHPEYLGNYASTAWDLPKELKDKAVAAAQAVHQKLAGDTSREDMRASGKVVQVNSLQDLSETYPEAQAAAFAELLKGFGQPHDAKAVAGFMEGRTGKEALAAVLAEQSTQKLVQDRAAIPPSPEIPAAKALAMELSRNPRLVSGQQSIEGWKKDLERIEPETAKLVDWSKFESGKMYYKADLAATLWQSTFKPVDVWGKAFRAWFGGSKVVDERGRPLRVYHGTATDVAAFDPSRAGENYPSTGGQEGLYFTDDSVIAGVYAEQAGYAEDGGEQITPVYLSLQNPLVRQTSGSSPDKYFDYNRTKILAAAKKAGADGIVVRGADRTLYVAFKGEQVKSAISNTGAFSNEDPGILFAGGPKKGSFSPATFELRLLADADLSTFLHESSHFFLAAYTDMAAQPGAPKALVDEVNAILAHLFKTVPGGAVAGGDLVQKVGAGETAPRLAPNGKPSKLNARQWAQVRTPEFKAWFGDWENAPANASKAVDENGEPKVYYHGSRKAGFLRFDTDGSGKTKGTGAFFTDDYQMSRGYAGGRGDDAPIYTAQEIFADPEVIDGLEIEEGVLVEVTVSSKGATAWQWYVDEEAALEALELEEGEDLAAKPGYRLLRDGYEEAVGTKEEVVAYIDTQEMETEAEGIYEVFLNVRDLVELDWQNRSWDEGPTEKVWEIFDENGDLYETAYDEEDRDRILAENPGYSAEEGARSSYESTDDAARQGRDMDADGILIKDVWDTGPDGHAESGNVLVVYKDTNIKSAISNTGAFSNEDPNILAQSQSARRPTTKKAPEDHLGEAPLTVDYTKIEDDKNEQNMKLVSQYPGIRFKARKADGGAVAGGDLAQKVGAGETADMFAKDFATKRTTITDTLVVSTKGDTEKVKRSNVNSEGRQISNTVSGLRRFWDWYTGSPEDINGHPILLYHSTTGDFNTFETMRETTNVGMFGVPFKSRRAGIFLTPQRGFSESYTEGKPGANTMQVYARMVNPADFRHGMTTELQNNLEANGINTRAVLNLQYDWEMFEDEYGGQELVAALKAAGYDGAIINEDDDNGKAQDTYVAFDSAQVKSATGNRGSWSSETDNILHEGGEVPAPGPLPDGATPLEIWSKMSLDQQRPYHEAWAEQFEQYAMTGKAPSLELDSAFKTFANWLKKIYISLKTFVATHTGGKLQPDTAAFFDRMLATEEQIATANAARSYTAMFKNAADAGMSDQKFADYMALSKEQAEDAEAMLRSRSLRDMAWLQRTRAKFIAGKQAEAAEMRKAVRDEIEKELAATPLRLAAKWLKKGEMTQADGTELKVLAGNKLQISDVEAIFPEGALTPRPDLRKLGYGQYGMLANEGLSPDLVAEMFGYRSGEALVRDLLEMKPFKEEVESLTDTRMLEENSEMLDPDAIAKEADAAIHNDARTRMVATELAALNNKVGSPAALMKAAKAYATQIIETKTSKTLKPWAFAAAETRAGKSALALLRKGKRDEAAEQKRVELVNHTAAKLAYQAEAELKKTIDRFKKIAGYKDDSSAIKSRDAEIVSAIRAILADFGIGTKGKTAREYLAVVQQHNPDLGDVLSDVIDSVSANAKDWREMKISELRDLSEEIEGLWFLAKRSKQIEIDGKLITLQEAQQAIYDRLDEIGIPDRVPGEGSAVTAAEKRGILFDRFVGALRRVEAWVGAKDGTLTGPFRQYMWNPIRDAADAYRADKVKYLKAYRDLLAPVAPTFTRRLIDAPEIGYVFGKDEGGMGKTELLHAILHTGNDSNKRKLLLGRGWATENSEGQLDTTKWDTFVQRMHDEGVLTKADYDFAQGVWNLLDSMKPLAQKAHRDVYGKYFSEVTANAFTNQFGTYAGGYVPAMADPLIVRDQDLNRLREGEEGNMAYAFPTTAKGFTKGRVEYNKPLKLDLRTLSQHIDKVLLFGHMTRPVNDVRRVMSGKAVAQALGRADPQAYNTLIMPWLNRAAKQVVETPTPGREGLGRFWSVVRARAGMAAMFANIANTVQQITGLSLAAVRVRPALLVDAMAKYVHGPKAMLEHVTGKSTYMQTRVENEVSAMSTQINEILLNPSVYESAKEWTSKHSYFLQSAMDNVISPVVWLAGYNQAIEQGLSELDAVRAGDSAVRETQGSMAPEDIAAFETGSAFYRMFVQFAGYFNMNANLLGTEFVKLSRDMGLKKGAGRGLYVLTLGLAAPAIVGELIIQAFRGGPDDDDKDGEYLDDWLMAVFGYGPLRYVTAMVPGFGTVINATVNTLNNKPYDDRISTAPAISMIESAVKAPVTVYKAIAEDGKPGRAVKDVATLISTSVGLPASGLARPVSYAVDVATGNVQPTGLWDATRGTITGAASPASKQ